jgi:hypothetical protein
MHPKKGYTKVFLCGLAFVLSIFPPFLSATFSQTVQSRVRSILLASYIEIINHSSRGTANAKNTRPLQ